MRGFLNINKFWVWPCTAFVHHVHTAFITECMVENSELSTVYLNVFSVEQRIRAAIVLVGLIRFNPVYQKRQQSHARLVVLFSAEPVIFPS